MEPLVTLLTLAGVAGLVVRLAGTLLRLGLRAAEVAAASGRTEISARRGDLTGLEEGRQVVRRARRDRRRELLLASALLVWLVVPPFAGWAREAYAIAAPLWLLPRPRLRTLPPGPPPE